MVLRIDHRLLPGMLQCRYGLRKNMLGQSNKHEIHALIDQAIRVVHFGNKEPIP